MQAGTTPDREAAPRQRARRRLALGVLALAAALLHAALLGGAGDAGPAERPGAEAMNVRLIAAQPAPVAGEPPPGPQDGAATAVPAVPAEGAENAPAANPANAPVVMPPLAPPPRRRSAREASTRPAPAAASAVVLADATAASAAAPAAPGASALPAGTDAAVPAASAPAAVPAAAAPVLAAASAPAAPAAVAPSTTTPLAAAGADSTAAAGPADALLGDEPVPTYRTRLPPATTLRYEVRRGFLRGSGEIQWRPAADAYLLRLEARIAGITLLAQTSQGGFDTDGLAPVRFVDQRARRQSMATNFQREAAKITFSGPSVELPLRRGTQDRLSWMIQLAGVLSADPALLAPGGKVAMVVVGARGDAALWVFRFVAFEMVDTVDGSVPAAKLVRDGRGPYDTSIEIWVDPTRHNLPVHAHQRSGSDEFDLLLEAMTPG